MIAYIIISVVFVIFACVVANFNQKMNNKLTAADTKIRSLEESLVWLHLNEDDRKILGSSSVPALLKTENNKVVKVCKTHDWSGEFVGPIISPANFAWETHKGTHKGVIKTCNKCPSQKVRGKRDKYTYEYNWYLDELRKEW